MCILFVSINAQAKANEYKLVLASNRDEFYERRARPAHYWEHAPHILGGMDMEPGREGGTWLAVNTVRGRIGILLNITSPHHCLNKKGRGSIVTNFLESQNPLETLEELQRDAASYNPFNLIMIDELDSAPELAYFTSMGESRPCLLLPVGVYGFGNSVISTPFRKVEDGRKRFEQVVRNFPFSNQREELIEGILEIMKSRQSHYPDPQLQEQARGFSTDFQHGLSSRFVDIRQAKYGSRTHTIISVTGDNVLNFEEWTMEEPINPNDPKWIHSSYSLRLPNTNA